ncbi:MAG: allantoicase [Candidatus Pseudothioglobus sp.]|jgi:allantoicase
MATMSAPIPAFLISYTDSSFTNPHEVLRANEPEDRKGTFTHMGARFWGFESRRHKATTIDAEGQGFTFDHDAHDTLTIGFNTPAKISNITVSTRWFTGNQVPCISVDLYDGQLWTTVLERVKLAPDQNHSFDVDVTEATECQVRCYHEGGISRINFFGELHVGQPTRINLLETARISHISNDHYGKPLDAVMGNRHVDHMYGWESARTGFGEQAMFTLAEPQVIDEIVVDTYLHRLNPPLSCHAFGLIANDGADLDTNFAQRPRWSIRFDDGTLVIPDNFQDYMLNEQFLLEPASQTRQFSIALHQPDDSPWQPLLTFGALFADTYHRFTEVECLSAVSHILYMHYPNGGIHGLKMFARKAT